MYLYLFMYLSLVTWLVAALLYVDGYLVHSKTEVALAPVLAPLAAALAGIRWGHAKYERYRY